MRKLVAESGNHGVVVRMSEGAKDVGDDESGELGVVFECPLFQQLTTFLF